MKTTTRRQFIKRTGIFALGSLTSGFPWIRTNARTSEVDVVVVGAGMAGLIATETLLAMGRSVILLEASNRIGGRVNLDKQTFNVPYDRGAHWLHQGSINPLLGYAKNNGFSVYKSPSKEILYIDKRGATVDEYREYNKAYRSTYRAIGAAGRMGKDVSPASVVPDVGKWNELVHLNIGPNEMAKDFDRFSCLDWWNSEGGEDWYCREGFGAIVEHRTASVPVKLNTSVTGIRWGKSGVVVETDKGDIMAKKTIVTVSNGVLASDGINFNPPLPVSKKEAFHDISMGVYNHIALQFRENFFGIGEDGYVIYPPESGKGDQREFVSPRGVSMLVNISGSNLSLCDVGGEFARELENEGVAGGIDFALGELRKIFGSRVDKHFIKGDMTMWASDPLFQGSYASAEPGKFAMRKHLGTDVAERLYFAGEACSKLEWSTVNGAYKTGEHAALQVHRSLPT